MKLTDENIEPNIDDEYYYRESNVVAIVHCKGCSGEEIKHQILQNQEIVERLRERIRIIIEEKDDFSEESQRINGYVLDHLQSILGEKK